MAEGTPVRDRLEITAITPDVAIEWGFNLYLADNTAEHTETNNSARTALREFERIVGQFPEGTPEHLYLNKLRMAATSFARGITRRKQTLASRLETARQAKESMVRQVAQTERMSGIVRGGLQLLLLGGFSYVLVRSLLMLPWIGEQVGGVEPQFASLASALGSALVGSFFKGWSMNRCILGLFDNYEDQLQLADREYSESVIREYELAAQFAYNAWTQLTGEPPPLTAAFRNLLMSVMGRCAEETAALGAEPSAPRGFLTTEPLRI